MSFSGTVFSAEKRGWTESNERGRGYDRAASFYFCGIRKFLHTVPDKAYVSLIVDGEASKLYAQYGFESVMPRSQGMFLRP